MNHKMQQKYIYEHTNFQNFLGGYTPEPPCGRGRPPPGPTPSTACGRARSLRDRSFELCMLVPHVQKRSDALGYNRR